MNDQQIVPVTMEVAWLETAIGRLYIGDTEYNPKPLPSLANGYWYVVVDSYNLNVVFNVMNADNADYPAELGVFLGNSRYYIFISTSDMRTTHLPVDKLFTLLKSLGASSNLTKVLQIGNQIGTSQLEKATYSIAANTDQSGHTAFDQYSMFADNATVVPLAFGAVTVAGQTIWTLGQLT